MLNNSPDCICMPLGQLVRLVADLGKMRACASFDVGGGRRADRMRAGQGRTGQERGTTTRGLLLPLPPASNWDRASVLSFPTTPSSPANRRRRRCDPRQGGQGGQGKQQADFDSMEDSHSHQASDTSPPGAISQSVLTMLLLLLLDDGRPARKMPLNRETKQELRGWPKAILVPPSSRPPLSPQCDRLRFRAGGSPQSSWAAGDGSGDWPGRPSVSSPAAMLSSRLRGEEERDGTDGMWMGWRSAAPPWSASSPVPYCRVCGDPWPSDE